ncbi:MAG: GH32 C-terminal domain-containing protein [Leifsonia sp.]
MRVVRVPPAVCARNDGPDAAGGAGGALRGGQVRSETRAEDGQVLITDQIFPDPASTGINAYATGGTASLVSLTVHKVASAWTTGKAAD